jgi:hypothetical protein
MLDGKLSHWEIAWVARGQAGPEGQSRGGDETIGLSQRPSALSELAPPFAGPMPLRETEGRFQQPGKESPSLGFLQWEKTTYDLLDIDGARVQHVAAGTQTAQFRDRGWATAQDVNEDGGVEQHRGHQPTRRDEARR